MSSPNDTAQEWFLAEDATRFSFAIGRDLGCHRDNQEDDCGFLVDDAATGDSLFLIADGMGGTSRGEVASYLTVRTVLTAYLRARQQGDAPDRALTNSITEAHSTIVQEAARNPDGPMGSTVVALAIHEGRLTWSHVGDSRLYGLVGSRLQRLTTDHSKVQRLVDEGILTQDAADHHPESNVITRALGRGAQIEVETRNASALVLDGNQFLLCSDGLTAHVPDSLIGDALLHLNARVAWLVLVDLARQLGGSDNIAVAVLRSTPPLEPWQIDAFYQHAANVLATNVGPSRRFAGLLGIATQQFSPQPASTSAAQSRSSRPQPSELHASATVPARQRNKHRGRALGIGVLGLAAVLLLVIWGLRSKTPEGITPPPSVTPGEIPFGDRRQPAVAPEAPDPPAVVVPPTPPEVGELPAPDPSVAGSPSDVGEETGSDDNKPDEIPRLDPPAAPGTDSVSNAPPQRPAPRPRQDGTDRPPASAPSDSAGSDAQSEPTPDPIPPPTEDGVGNPPAVPAENGGPGGTPEPDTSGEQTQRTGWGERGRAVGERLERIFVGDSDEPDMTRETPPPSSGDDAPPAPAPAPEASEPPASTTPEPPPEGSP